MDEVDNRANMSVIDHRVVHEEPDNLRPEILVLKLRPQPSSDDRACQPRITTHPENLSPTKRPFDSEIGCGSPQHVPTTRLLPDGRTAAGPARSTDVGTVKLVVLRTKSLLLAKCPSAGYAHEEESSQPAP
jgi:hypothetical protein